MKRLILAATLAFGMTGAAMAVSYTDLLARPHAQPDARLAYGAGPQQFVELWLPKGDRPHPVILMIHGGCWLSELPGLELMDPLAEALKAHGYAVWNIEYRRIGAQGGGYPATFQDAMAASEKLREAAPRYHLDLAHVVAVGHSAGGHLAMWLQARARVPAGSPLHGGDPLKLRGVVSLAGILDLKGYREDGAPCGGAPTIDGITGAADRKGQDVYADTAPQAMLPIGGHVFVVAGGVDRIVPDHWRASYVAAARAAGDKPGTLTIPEAGHFELIDPQSSAFAPILNAIAALNAAPSP
jgi:acetyl esterase/lipase